MRREIEPKGSTFEKKPTSIYYEYVAKENQHEKVKILVKGQKFLGTFQHTFKDTEFDKDKPPQKHLIDTQAEGQIQIKGCTSLNMRLEGMKRGTPIEIVFLGKGKPAKKSQRPPYLFKVYDLTDEAKVSEKAKASEASEEADDHTDAPETDAKADSEEAPW